MHHSKFSPYTKIVFHPENGYDLRLVHTVQALIRFMHTKPQKTSRLVFIEVFKASGKSGIDRQAKISRNVT